MWSQRPSYRFELDNFSKKEAVFASQIFVSGGCEWFLSVYPKGDSLADNNHMSVYLSVANPTLLPTGWKRSADFYFVLLDQSDKELHRSPIARKGHTLCATLTGLGYRNTMPLNKLQEKGVLENDKIIIEVYISNVVVGEGKEDVVSKKETVEINGFQVLASQATLVWKLFEEHPDIAEDFKPKNQMVMTSYMNVLLNLIETFDNPLKNFSKTELSKASSELSELIEQGFKLDWLKSKLCNKVSLKRKETDSDDSQVVQQLEERIKNLVMELGSLKSKFEEVSLKMKNVEDSDGYRIKQMEERFKFLEHMELRNVKAKFEEVSLETNQSYDADWSRVQQQEERIKNLELMVSNLNVELDKKNAKSSC